MYALTRPLALAGATLAAFGGSQALAAEPVPLSGVKTELITDGMTTRALTENGITIAPVGDARARAARGGGLPKLVVRFPITGGSVDPETLAGSIDHSGGVVFTNTHTGKSLTLTDFTINIDDHPDLVASVNGDPNVRVSILDLDLTNIQVRARGEIVRIRGVQAHLNETAADALNASLGVSLFAPGIRLGWARVKAEIGD